MEQILTFVLGVLLVLAVAGVYNMFKTSKQVKKLTEESVNKERLYEDNFRLLDIRIDQEIDRINRIYEELLKYTDSRTDKLESRIDTRFNDNTAFIDGLFHTVDAIKSKLKKK
tara:strand:- start:423 stop:761 length:339 start_codon:yes stop_codon:yes gene_type:complete